MPELSPERLAELQKELDALMDKYEVDLKPTQTLTIMAYPRPAKEEPKQEEHKEDAKAVQA